MMIRGRFFSYLLRLLCLLYGVASVALAIYAGNRGSVVQLPASLDPSLVIRPFWIALGIVSQAIVVCAFLTAVAESVEDVDSADLLEPEIRQAGESQVRFSQKSSSPRLFGVSQS